MKQFEYKVEMIDIDVKTALNNEQVQERLSNILNEYGKAGWRLCGVNKSLYYFTRPRV